MMADLSEYREFEGIEFREEIKALMQIFADSWDECRKEDCSKCKFRHGKEQYTLMACLSERYAEKLIASEISLVRHGRWIYVDTDKEEFFVCNRCKKKEYWESNYCPNCGAKMDGGMTDCTRHECSECDIKEAFRHLGPFGLLFIGYKGDPRGPIGRAGNMTLPEEALVMGTLVDVDGNRWVPVNEEVLLELISEYKKSEGGPQ